MANTICVVKEYLASLAQNSHIDVIYEKHCEGHTFLQFLFWSVKLKFISPSTVDIRNWWTKHS